VENEREGEREKVSRKRGHTEIEEEGGRKK
jgi:hypothetical protein